MLDLRTGQKPDEVAREKGHDGIANDILAYPDGPFEAISEQMDTDTAAARWDDARAVALPPPETGDRFDYKWLDEECAYAAKLRQLYDRGVLRLAKGTRLAEFLGEQLNRDAPAVNSRYWNNRTQTTDTPLGQRVYKRKPDELETLKADGVESARIDLETLASRSQASVARQLREAAESNLTDSFKGVRKEVLDAAAVHPRREFTFMLRRRAEARAVDFAVERLDNGTLVVHSVGRILRELGLRSGDGFVTYDGQRFTTDDELADLAGRLKGSRNRDVPLVVRPVGPTAAPQVVGDNPVTYFNTATRGTVKAIDLWPNTRRGEAARAELNKASMDELWEAIGWLYSWVPNWGDLRVVRKSQLVDLIVASEGCLAPWARSNRKTMRSSYTLRRLIKASMGRARAQLKSYEAHEAARAGKPLPRTGATQIVGTYNGQYNRLRKLKAADFAAWVAQACVNAQRGSLLPYNADIAEIMKIMKNPGFESHNGFHEKFDCYCCGMPVVLRGWFVAVEHDHSGEILSIRLRKICNVCNTGDVADVDKLRKKGLSESECRTVVYQLVGEFKNTYRYFGS